MANYEALNVPGLSVLELMNRDLVGIVWDRGEPESVRGLHLRTHQDGKKCFYFRYYISHEHIEPVRRRIRIGSDITLTTARAICRQYVEEIRLGLDPLEKVRSSSTEKIVSDVFNILCRDYWSLPRFQESGRAREVLNIYKSKIEKPFGRKRLSLVRTPEVRVWHSAMHETPAMANRALEVLTKIFSYGMEMEWIKYNCPKHVVAFKEKKRKRVPSPDEIKILLKALFEIANDESDRHNLAAIYVLALFYTGARPKMLNDVKWSDTVWNGKIGYGIAVALKGKLTYETGENERLFIPHQILKLLDKYPKSPTGHMFDNSGGRGLWRRINDGGHIKDLWMRDARKAFASIAKRKGVSLALIGDALNHKSVQTTLRYAQSFDETNAETTLTVASALDEISELF